MKFGIEIEFYSPKTMTETAKFLRKKIRGIAVDEYSSSSWRFVRDASLHEVDGFNGMELVSPILDTDKATNARMLRKICAALQELGGMVNTHCGLHVHIDASNLSVEQIKTVFHRYTKFENVIDLMVPMNRRGAHTYYSKGGTNIVDDVERCQTTEALMHVQGDRYYKVNLCALQRHGTIEFRQHSGSINGDTILNWVEFLSSFIEASKGSAATVAQPAARRGRPRASWIGMTSGCQKVYDVFMASHRNGGGTLFLATIANRSGLAPSSIKVAISQLKTMHGILIKKLPGQRGNTNPSYTITNPYAQPRVDPTPTSLRTTATVADEVWRGISKSLKAYYVERIQELSGFAVRNLPL
jgi:hypothetical protein